MSDDLARALERRSLRAHQVVTATAAALLVVLAQHASPDREVIAAAGAAAVVTFAVALVLACREVRSVDVLALASPRRVRVVASSLERLAGAAESGHLETRLTRPPRSVLELAPEAATIRELAKLLRAHGHASAAAVEACDRFVDHSWNAELRDLDHELLRRELGRLRFALAAGELRQISVTR